MTDDKWQACSDATTNKAKGLYTALVTISDTPGEAAQILTSAYVALWLLGGADGADLEENLQQFCECVRMNVALKQEGTRQ